MTPVAAASPRLSVVIPALHEGAGIISAVAHIHRMAGEEKVQVVVVDGDGAGSTLVHLPAREATGLLACPGRAVQMNAGAAVATGEAFLFLHADTRLPADGLVAVRHALAQGVQVGAFDLDIESPRPMLRAIAAVGRLRSRLTRLPYGDQAQFFTRAAFRRLGGYARLPLMEDVDIMRRAKKLGLRPVLLRQRVRTSPRRWQREGALSATLRNWGLMAAYLCGVHPAHLARWYPTHVQRDDVGEAGP